MFRTRSTNTERDVRSTPEQDRRLDMFNTLLTTPHRNLEQAWPVHETLIAEDPLFYVRLAAWYREHGDVRDHKELFIVALVLSDFEGHREVGLAMLRELPPYQVGRVVDFIHGRKTRVGSRPKTDETPTGRKARKARRHAQTATEPQTNDEPVVKSFGLFKNVPRSVKTEVTRYLKERERNAEWFDSSVLQARKTLKRLYALLHVSPSERAQKILFENDPPTDSKLFALRQLSKAGTPAEQAEAIITHRIPYRVASTVVTQFTPTVLLALIDQMSPQELINSIGSLQKRGVLDHPELKPLVTEKLRQAKSAKRVSAYKAEKAIDAATLSDDVREALQDVTAAQVKSKGRISRPTALLIDKSASMQEAIEIGCRIGAMISSICESDLFTYAFDTMPYPITPRGDDLADWTKALEGLTAGGATSIGAPVAAMTKKRQVVEQIIIVTDEGENSHPLFNSALEEYCETLKVAPPQVVLVRTRTSTGFVERQCRTKGVACDVFQFEGDYYSLPNLIPLLARPSRLELLMEIMAYPLPERKAA